jgi:hypothetical protein
MQRCSVMVSSSLAVGRTPTAVSPFGIREVH